MILSKNVINKKYENVRVIPQTYRKIPPPPPPHFSIMVLVSQKFDCTIKVRNGMRQDMK